MPRIRINAHLCAFAYIYLYNSGKCTELVYILPVRRARVCVYTHTGTAVVYLKRLTMAIAMVGGGDDTGDRLGESLGTERGKVAKGEKGRRRKSNGE